MIWIALVVGFVCGGLAGNCFEKGEFIDTAKEAYYNIRCNIELWRKK